MKFIQYLDGKVLKLRHPVVAIGNFDGVHAGHQEIFRQVRRRATEIGGEAVVLSFDPHPLFVLAPEQRPSLLSTLEEKRGVVESLGIDYFILVRFDEPFSRLSPEDFVQRILKRQLQVEEVYVGYDFTFGHRAAGDPHVLALLGGKYRFGVTTIPQVSIDKVPISSSIIREFVREGKIREATRFLGRYPTLSGKVVHGMDRGQKVVGFATANLNPVKDLVPKDGVYVCWVKVGKEWFPGAVNIGINPTFKNNPFTIEAHLLDFQGNLYGEEITLAFIERLRDEEIFPSSTALSDQIRKDVEKAKEILSKSPKPMA
jgi:riboflavin kinase/FMN adenylyltransferase